MIQLIAYQTNGTTQAEWFAPARISRMRPYDPDDPEAGTWIGLDQGDRVIFIRVAESPQTILRQLATAKDIPALVQTRRLQ